MLGWFVGRTLRRNALRDVDNAQSLLAPDVRLAVARRVIAQMAVSYTHLTLPTILRV